MEWLIQITGLTELIANLRDYPSISAPILQRALSASQAVLAQNTNKTNVPWRTGFLVQTFQAQLETGVLRWFPTASYARFVEFGTAPHRIAPKNAMALFWPGADHPVRSVLHPGTRPNPYMERIVQASTDDINEQFGNALQQILQQIAAA
jgi:hypothetical protein